MKQHYMDIVKQNMLMTSELMKVVKILEENNIESISCYLGTFGKNATKNFKLTLKSDTLLYEPLELIFPYKDTLSTPKNDF